MFRREAAVARVASAQAFTVYTQNVYLGGDTGPIFTIDFSNIPALIAATSLFWAEVQAHETLMSSCNFNFCNPGKNEVEMEVLRGR